MAFNSNRETEAGGSLSLRLCWPVERVPGQDSQGGLYGETLSQTSYFTCVFLSMCVYITVCLGGHGGQQGVGSSGIGITGGFELPCVLGTGSGSSAGAASTLSH